eukprot:jgi/Chrzof1/3300/Cz12g20040.t1
MHLQDLAEADAAKEQIQQVQEFYGDFMALDKHHFIVPVQNNEVLINPKAVTLSGQSEYEVVDRLVQGLSALFLAVRRRPIIRYQRGSDNSQRLADSLYNLVYRQQCSVFDFGSRSSPVVLLLDRRDDPVTPLLTQWSYQAMIHELIGLKDSTMKLTSPKISDAFRDIVLEAGTDEFYRQHMYHNYGDVGVGVKELVDKFSASTAQHKQVNSLEDMRRFVMEHSDFSRAQSNVSKHVNIMTQLSEEVSKRNLMDLSTMEQELANPAANLTAAASYDEVMTHMRGTQTSDKDKVRLVMLYALRFEGEAVRLRGMMDFLNTCGLKDSSPQLYAAAEGILKYAGAERRAGDLYGGGNILVKAKNVFKGLQGVDNVYTQHAPLLVETINQLSSNNLSAAAYPYMASSQDEALAWQSAYKQRPPSDMIVFILGGTTYEESKAVHEWNAKHAANPAGGSTRVILGGSTILNSDAFLAALGANTSTARQ